MSYYYNKDINLLDIFNICIMFSLFIFFMYLNYNIAIVFCSNNDIPFNLMVSTMSIGFGYELTLVSTIIELGIIGYCISKFIK